MSSKTFKRAVMRATFSGSVKYERLKATNYDRASVIGT
jgi:hypothetical protein